jgi:hypothetical protein
MAALRREIETRGEVMPDCEFLVRVRDGAVDVVNPKLPHPPAPSPNIGEGEENSPAGDGDASGLDPGDPLPKKAERKRK